MSITVFESSTLVVPEHLDCLPLQSEALSWDGECLPYPLQWLIVRDPRKLWFVVSAPGGSAFERHHSAGDFVEGLWERDVAELFIKESSGRYQEFNVSPGGAWWTVVLSSYRTREAKQPEMPDPIIRAQVGEGRWRALLGVDLSSLAVDLSESSSLHVSGITQKPQRLFLSSRPVASVEPDFHHPGAFVPVHFQSLP